MSRYNDEKTSDSFELEVVASRHDFKEMISMKPLRIMMPFLFALLVCGCSHSSFDPTTEKAKLLQRDAEWSQVSSEGKDVEKIVSYWSDDAQLIVPGAPIAQGKDAIRKFVSDSLKTPGFNIHWAAQDAVFSPDGKMAYISETSEIKTQDPKAGLITIHSRGVTIWRHDADGEWRCVIDISNEAPKS